MPESTLRIPGPSAGEIRTVWLQPPRDPATARHLVVFLDAEFYRDQVGAPAVLAALAGELADAWYAFVPIGDLAARSRDCPCHPPFARFVVAELLPALARRHPEIGAVRHRTLVGLSYTGLAAAFVAAEFPGAFDRVIAQSGSFWSDDAALATRIRRDGVRLPTAFYLEVGDRETATDVRHANGAFQALSQIEGVRRLRDALRELGHEVVYSEFPGGHDFAAWRTTLPAALRWALPRA